MTGTNCDLFTHNQSRSYLKHLVFATYSHICERIGLSCWKNVGKVLLFLDFRFSPWVEYCVLALRFLLFCNFISHTARKAQNKKKKKTNKKTNKKTVSLISDIFANQVFRQVTDDVSTNRLEADPKCAVNIALISRRCWAVERRNCTATLWRSRDSPAWNGSLSGTLRLLKWFGWKHLSGPRKV
jgi:hypothetical protein